MSKCVDSYAGGEVEVATTCFIPEVGTLALGEDNWCARVIRENA